jgi:hypothetical protein
MCLTCTGPCCSGPTQVLYIISLDTPRGDLVEICLFHMVYHCFLRLALIMMK